MNVPVRFPAVLALVAMLACGGNSTLAETTLSQQSDPQSTAKSPIEVVNQRMAAYNSHSIEPFFALYSDEVEVFNYPDRSLGKGKKHLRGIFEPMFREGKVQVEVHYQLAKDSYVINHETVTYGDDKTEYVSIYEVRDGLIRSVRFVRD